MKFGTVLIVLAGLAMLVALGTYMVTNSNDNAAKWVERHAVATSQVLERAEYQSSSWGGSSEGWELRFNNGLVVFVPRDARTPKYFVEGRRYDIFKDGHGNVVVETAK